jgi:hypothetical protein
VLLTLAIALAAIAVTPIGFMLSRAEGVACVWLASVICWAPGVAVLAFQDKFRDPQLMMLNVAAGFLGRLAIPLSVCMVIYLRGGPLVEAGFAVYLLGLYLVALAVGTLLDLAQHESKQLQSIESTR